VSHHVCWWLLFWSHFAYYSNILSISYWPNAIGMTSDIWQLHHNINKSFKSGLKMLHHCQFFHERAIRTRGGRGLKACARFLKFNDPVYKLEASTKQPMTASKEDHRTGKTLWQKISCGCHLTDVAIVCSKRFFVINVTASRQLCFSRQDVFKQARCGVSKPEAYVFSQRCKFEPTMDIMRAETIAVWKIGIILSGKNVFCPPR